MSRVREMLFYITFYLIGPSLNFHESFHRIVSKLIEIKYEEGNILFFCGVSDGILSLKIAKRGAG